VLLLCFVDAWVVRVCPFHGSARRFFHGVMCCHQTIVQQRCSWFGGHLCIHTTLRNYQFDGDDLSEVHSFRWRGTRVYRRRQTHIPPRCGPGRSAMFLSVSSVTMAGPASSTRRRSGGHEIPATRHHSRMVPSGSSCGLSWPICCLKSV